MTFKEVLQGASNDLLKSAVMVHMSPLGIAAHEDSKIVTISDPAQLNSLWVFEYHNL